MKSFPFLLCVLLVLVSWDEKKPPLFKLLAASQTGVNFKNTITENDQLNILNEAYIYNGGGVGIGDFNNDGLQDIYFAGNMVSNKLYLNKGSMKFDDVTLAAGVAGEGRWSMGVSVADVNADGRLDIYVSASFLKDAQKRKNLLYINQGNNKQGVPVFKEMARTYGIADDGYSTQGVFFDYDRDGDLDLFILTNTLYDPKTPIQFRPKVTDGTALNTDRLYRNNGNSTFTNVSKEAGILIEGWGHAVSISDINQDGWPDIYVSNDFVSNDIFYLNNKDGTFSNKISDYFKHTSWFTMGTDIADINNDGLPDLVALDMLPEGNLRKKGMLIGNEYYNYFNARKFGYQHQYVRNTLQLNAGMTPKGHVVFSEIGCMSGIYETDWSWTPLVADFDNDGFRDLIVTNGLPRDVTDLDYISFDNGQAGSKTNLTLKMAQLLPVVKISNYAFKNAGGAMFSDKTKDWGLNKSSFSNGGVYADLDNDGDLDLVINNINDLAFIYENTLNNKEQTKETHSLSVVLEGSGKNTRAIGSVIRIYYGAGKQQFYEHQPCRGYLSTVDSKAHFGIGSASQVDSLRVWWPDGTSQLQTNIKVDQTINIIQQSAAGILKFPLHPLDHSVFAEVADRYGIKFKHQEKDAVDFNIQPTLPHKLSQYGPGIAVADIDKNGFDDFYLGGAASNSGVFFMQDSDGHFTIDSTRVKMGNVPIEQMGVLFFDADNDNDADLYIVGGSYEFAPNYPGSQDRLYINNGKGEFELDASALPKELSNGSCVRAADFDADGDLDLFVGARSVSGLYPVAPKSYLLRNDGGKFIDVTMEVCPILLTIGMVTDALWSDFDNDGKADLVLTGEWMPITFLKNTGTSMVSLNDSTGIAQHVGWWNSLASGDFDNDGDIDYVAGNLGLNSTFKGSAKEPMTIYAKDINDDGKIDPMIFCFMNAEDSSRKLFPVHTRDDLISEVVGIRKKFPTYQSFGRSSVDEILSKQDRDHAIVLKANELATSYIENQGNGHFAIRPLPLETQVAPVYGVIARDFNDDGFLDLIMVGNDYGMEPGSGRHDAFTGLCLQGDGKGNFMPLSIAESGFFADGDAKGLATVQSAKNEELIVVTQNQDSLLVFTNKAKQGDGNSKWIEIHPDDFCADLVYKDKRKQRIEFYYGSTFLSQSSRKIRVDKSVEKMSITNFKQNRRDIQLD